jgi:hypothetical protein
MNFCDRFLAVIFAFYCLTDGEFSSFSCQKFSAQSRKKTNIIVHGTPAMQRDKTHSESATLMKYLSAFQAH